MNTRKMLIEFESDPDVMVPKPWPVGVNTDFDVTSGLGNDDGARLIGFGQLGTQHVDVLAEQALDAPESVIGMVPSFSGAGGMFEWQMKVSSIKVIDMAGV